MRHAAAAILVLAVHVGTGGAQGESAYRELQRRHGGHLRDLSRNDTHIRIEGAIRAQIDAATITRFQDSASGTPERAAETRAIGKAFLREDGDALGACSVEDWVEDGIDVDGVHAVIGYSRYVRGLRIESAGVTLSISPVGEIVSVVGRKVACTPEMATALASPHLTEAQVGEIIKPHLGPRPYYNWELRRMQSTTDGGATLGRFTKTVVADPPYVVWVVQTGGARYRVDARTGAILGKELPPPRGDLY